MTEPEDEFAALIPREARPPCQLYLISPPAFDLDAHGEALEAALAAGGPVAAYQLRLKDLADAV
ncbi:MAG: thiamine phosphate synthase, partial [Thermaurantiacus sp.]